MKKFVIALGLIALLSLAAAAQTVKARVAIPFDFRAGNQLLPAGHYTVHVDPAFRRLTLRSADLRAALVLGTYPASRAAESGSDMLVFRRYGNAHFLRQIWTAGARAGHQLPVTAAEREMARLTAQREVASLHIPAK